MMKKQIIECQKPRLFLETYKPKRLEDLSEIEKLLDPKEFPKSQKKMSFNKQNEINIIILNKKNYREFRNNPSRFNDQMNKRGWLLFIHPSDRGLVGKLKKDLDFFNRFKEHPYIFGKVKIKEISYNFENELDSVFGLLVRRELYDSVGRISLKFFDLDMAFYDLVRKLSRLFFMIDLSKCGFNRKSTILKNKMDLEFERDFYASLEREPFQASIYDKYILDG